MNVEQKARAIACIEKAERIGRHRAFYDNGNPCCSLGILLVCAGVGGKEARKREIEPISVEKEADYPERFPELASVYGLEREEIRGIVTRNDETDGFKARRERVLSYLSSIEVDS